MPIWDNDHFQFQPSPREVGAAQIRLRLLAGCLLLLVTIAACRPRSEPPEAEASDAREPVRVQEPTFPISYALEPQARGRPELIFVDEELGIVSGGSRGAEQDNKIGVPPWSARCLSDKGRCFAYAEFTAVVGGFGSGETVALNGRPAVVRKQVSPSNARCVRYSLSWLDGDDGSSNYLHCEGIGVVSFVATPNGEDASSYTLRTAYGVLR